jgi:hypothetical protein
LLTAWEQQDHDTPSALMTTFGVLRETLYASQNSPLIGVVVALEDAARDALMGFNSKGQVPSSQKIKAAMYEAAK